MIGAKIKMSGFKEINGYPYIWCVWCRNYIRADIPHKCANTEVFKTQVIK